MKISVLISNFNYSKYICEAIQSALSQSRPPDEIIVIDDGSSDGSVELIEAEFKENSKVRLICQENKGQLSTFNTGFQETSGDLIFFLDADDIYREQYIERAVEFHMRHPDCDFLHCGMEKFGDLSEFDLAYPKNQDYGFSVIEALRSGHFRGGPTSSLSIRRSVLEAFLPLDLEVDWITRADDCLIYGSGVVGAHKFFLSEPLVRYRVHDSNSWHGKSFSKHDELQRDYNLNRLVGTIAARSGYYESSLLDNLVLEFESARSGRNNHDLARYLTIASRAERGFGWRSLCRIKLIYAYFKMRLEGRHTAPV